MKRSLCAKQHQPPLQLAGADAVSPLGAVHAAKSLTAIYQLPSAIYQLPSLRRDRAVVGAFDIMSASRSRTGIGLVLPVLAARRQ
jgi:hypothetical protein